ncbi:Hypothetical protein IALB_2479 [Ignavibacterium album JCM 16511]|uniref:Uncharacterized protein n=1 Tax=Ignavibacterium album (strain DSM 19864 / JCM 16511 / NBRC 101810 / Mat9-16) TaxID=945713 RepID=I0AMH5_IGNAJ|nr:Hypothetical protein IALB_2479 [Ignavibacterium album JCM 16511]
MSSLWDFDLIYSFITLYNYIIPLGLLNAFDL